MNEPLATHEELLRLQEGDQTAWAALLGALTAALGILGKVGFDSFRNRRPDRPRRQDCHHDEVMKAIGHMARTSHEDNGRLIEVMHRIEVAIGKISK